MDHMDSEIHKLLRILPDVNLASRCAEISAEYRYSADTVAMKRVSGLMLMFISFQTIKYVLLLCCQLFR